MKIQNMAIILVAIILPITLLLSAYTKTQIDTINIQTMYSTKLKDATYDAISAFQLNTNKNEYSTVSDSMRRDIEAAVQTFMNNLATNLEIPGATDNYLKPYIPAMVFTLYDGYYIYSPSYNYTELNETTEDNDGFTIESSEGTLTTDEVIERYSNRENAQYNHILKPYIYYTVRYAPENTNTDVVVNYSLDNYVVVYGMVKGQYVTRSGYLVANRPEIDENEELHKRLPVTTIVFPDRGYNHSLISESDIGILSVAVQDIAVTNDYLLQDRLTNMDQTVEIKKQDIDAIPGLKSKSLYYSEQYINGVKEPRYGEGTYKTGWYIDPQSNQYYVEPDSAKQYYDAAVEFTEWFTQNLGEIKASDAIKPDGTPYENMGDEKIFNISSTNDPESTASAFSEHKREAIKRSIQDNLSQAIASYNQNSEALNTTYNFKMPILSETEWDQVLTNVCIITFMQGIQAGTKIYNDYAIVTSTKNKEYVSPDSIYYINTTGGDGKYHKLGCSHLDSNSPIVGYRNTEFDRKSYEVEDFKRDNEGNQMLDENGQPDYQDITQYYYMHEEQACYYCIVNSTDEGSAVDWKNDDVRLKAYYTALAREKFKFYKTNGYFAN